MRTTNWKGTALLAPISVISLGALLSGIPATLGLPLFGSASLASWVVLFVLTVAVSRFTVSVTSTDGVHSYRKSIADAFVFLAIILYAGPPLNAPGPAVLLAALVGFLSTYRLATRRAEDVVRRHHEQPSFQLRFHCTLTSGRIHVVSESIRGLA